MKRKKLFDFTLSTAIIILAAYAVVFTVSLFMLLHNEGDRTAGIIFNAILAASLLAIIVYYLVLAPTAADDGIRHFRRFIPRQHLSWDIVYNPRLRITEIICTDASIHDQTVARKSEIRIQHTSRSETYLDGYAPVGKSEGGR